MEKTVLASWVGSVLHHVQDGLAVHGDVAQVPPTGGVRQQREDHGHKQRDQHRRRRGRISYHHENESFIIGEIRTDFFPLPTQTDWRDLRLSKILFHPPFLPPLSGRPPDATVR